MAAQAVSRLVIFANATNRWLELLEATDAVLAQRIRRSRNRALAPLARKVEKAWAVYFRKQGAWWTTERLSSIGVSEATSRRLPGKAESALRSLSEFDDGGRTLQATLSEVGNAMILGGRELIKRLAIDISFSLANPRAVSYMERRGAELVTQINETSRKRLRTILSTGIDEGWSYSKLASAIRTRFEDFSRQRARAIAITELGNAYTESMSIVGHQLQAQGIKMQKRWITVGDSRVDPIDCAPNGAAGWIPMKQLFPSGAAQPLAHTLCRCALDLRAV